MSEVLPKTMRFVEISQPGGPEMLRLTRGRVPTAGAGEVLIEVGAAGVNRPDIAQRQGVYPPPPGASPHPGLEVAGRVVAMGPDVPNTALHQRVCALTNGGGYAEFVCVPWTQCLPVPGPLSLIEAAALPEACFTVWTNLFERGALHKGESLLIHGGSSGIGTTAIQIARASDCTVFATAGSAQKCRACEQLGAELGINYRNQDFVTVMLQATAGRGVDVILDMVAGSYLKRNIEVAAQGGRIVMIATLGGGAADIEILPILSKGLTITGSVLRPRTTLEKAAIAMSLRERVWPMFESGAIRPVVFQTFSLTRAADAHSLMENGSHIGKIVLEVRRGATR